MSIYLHYKIELPGRCNYLIKAVQKSGSDVFWSLYFKKPRKFFYSKWKVLGYVNVNEIDLINYLRHRFGGKIKIDLLK
jgi:hypothetical protein